VHFWYAPDLKNLSFSTNKSFDMHTEKLHESQTRRCEDNIKMDLKSAVRM
jgi:hypothetical protein